MTNFFTNTHEVDTFNFEVEKKVHVSGKISERWVQLLSRSIACGEDKKRVIEKKVGISKTERDDLESLLKGNIGVKGIASIESQIKAKTGIEVKLEYATIETEETTFKAPECGRKTLIVYQLVREYDISIMDKRFFSFSKGQTRIILTEYTDNIHDKSLTTDNDPDCGCKDKLQDADDGILSLLINKYYQLVTPYKMNQDKVSLKNLGIEISIEDLGNMTLDRYTINASLLPNYIVFLASIKSEEVNICLTSNGNLAFDYAERIRFNENLQPSAFPEEWMKGTIGVAYPFRKGYGYPYDPYHLFSPFPYGSGEGFIIPTDFPQTRSFGQQGESLADE